MLWRSTCSWIFSVTALKARNFTCLVLLLTCLAVEDMFHWFEYCEVIVLCVLLVFFPWQQLVSDKTNKRQLKQEAHGATTRSPEWNCHCRYADGMQHFSNTLMTRQWLKQFLKYLAHKVKMLKFSNVTRKKSHSQCLLPTFESTGISVQQKKRKIDFQDDSHLGFPIGMIIAIFDLQVTLMLPTKFRVNWLLGLGEEVKNRFSRWLSWRPSWISDWHDFSYFLSTSHPDAS